MLSNHLSSRIFGSAATLSRLQIPQFVEDEGRDDHRGRLRAQDARAQADGQGAVFARLFDLVVGKAPFRADQNRDGLERLVARLQRLFDRAARPRRGCDQRAVEAAELRNRVLPRDDFFDFRNPAAVRLLGRLGEDAASGYVSIPRSA